MRCKHFFILSTAFLFERKVSVHYYEKTWLTVQTWKIAVIYLLHLGAKLLFIEQENF